MCVYIPNTLKYAFLRVAVTAKDTIYPFSDLKTKIHSNPGLNFTAIEMAIDISRLPVLLIVKDL